MQKLTAGQQRLMKKKLELMNFCNIIISKTEGPQALVIT